MGTTNSTPQINKKSTLQVRNDIKKLFKDSMSKTESNLLLTNLNGGNNLSTSIDFNTAVKDIQQNMSRGNMTGGGYKLNINNIPERQRYELNDELQHGGEHTDEHTQPQHISKDSDMSKDSVVSRISKMPAMTTTDNKTLGELSDTTTNGVNGLNSFLDTMIQNAGGYNDEFVSVHTSDAREIQATGSGVTTLPTPVPVPAVAEASLPTPVPAAAVSGSSTPAISEPLKNKPVTEITDTTMTNQTIGVLSDSDRLTTLNKLMTFGEKKDIDNVIKDKDYLQTIVPNPTSSVGPKPQSIVEPTVEPVVMTTAEAATATVPTDLATGTSSKDMSGGTMSDKLRQIETLYNNTVMQGGNTHNSVDTSNLTEEAEQHNQMYNISKMDNTLLEYRNAQMTGGKKSSDDYEDSQLSEAEENGYLSIDDSSTTGTATSDYSTTSTSKMTSATSSISESTNSTEDEDYANSPYTLTGGESDYGTDGFEEIQQRIEMGINKQKLQNEYLHVSRPLQSDTSSYNEAYRRGKNYSRI
jgi:hypothetical protein